MLSLPPPGKPAEQAQSRTSQRDGIEPDRNSDKASQSNRGAKEPVYGFSVDSKEQKWSLHLDEFLEPSVGGVLYLPYSLPHGHFAAASHGQSPPTYPVTI